MAFESITDEKIKYLLECNKRIAPDSKESQKKANGYIQKTYMVKSEDGNHYFEIYTRENKREGLEDDFSCSITYKVNGETITLKRYNGASHEHTNKIEKEKISYKPHIHIATERYIKMNQKPEGFAESTERYISFAEAFNCLIKDCKISGIELIIPFEP